MISAPPRCCSSAQRFQPFSHRIGDPTLADVILDRIIHAVVLDINLHGVKSYPIADSLVAKDIRFVFTTGFGSDVLDQRYRRHPLCEKPFSREAIVMALTI